VKTLAVKTPAVKTRGANPAVNEAVNDAVHPAVNAAVNEAVKTGAAGSARPDKRS